MMFDYFEPWPDCPLDGYLDDYKEASADGERHAHLLISNNGPGWGHHSHEKGEQAHRHEEMEQEAVPLALVFIQCAECLMAYATEAKPGESVCPDCGGVTQLFETEE